MSEKFTRGDCGHFCEACARRDDKIAVLYEALDNLIETIERVDPGVYDLSDARAALAKAAP